MEPHSQQSDIPSMQLLDELDDAIFLVDRQDCIMDTNQAACNLYGYTKSQFCRMQLKDLLAPNIALLSSTSPLSSPTPTTWHCDKEGQSFYVEILERPIKNCNTCDLSLVRIRNISSAHLAEQQRQRDYQIYRAVVESGPALIARVLPDTTITFANDRFCTYFGHKRCDMTGKKLTTFPPDAATRNFICNYFADYAQNPQITTHDNIVINHGSEDRWVQFTESPIFDSLGNLHEIQIVAMDIHEQKLAEIKTQQNEAKYRAIMDQSNEGIALIEIGTGKILEVNRKVGELLSYTTEELLLHCDFELTTETQDTLQKEEAELYQHASLPLKPIHIIAKDGKLIEVERLVKLLTIDGKKVALTSLRDVSERKQINALLRKQADELKQKVEQLQKAWAQTIDVLAAASEAKDPYTAGHQKRVAQLAVAIGKELNLPDEQITALRMAALIHDIGKITIPSELLSKPGALTLLEYKLVQVHVSTGYDLLRNLELPWNVAEVVHQHHERCDGSGYPNQLNGDQILHKAKILAIADVVEAMSSHRPYRPSLGTTFALNEIEQNKGTLFDPDAVNACITLFREKGFCFDTSPATPIWHMAK